MPYAFIHIPRHFSPTFLSLRPSRAAWAFFSFDSIFRPFDTLTRLLRFEKSIISFHSSPRYRPGRSASFFRYMSSVYISWEIFFHFPSARYLDIIVFNFQYAHPPL